MSGFSLVLLPGLACDAAMWAGVLPALKSWRPQVADVHMRLDTIEAMADALLKEHEGPLVLAGASMGGMVAMEAARQAPERVAGLALLATIPHPETPQMRQVREDAIRLFREGRTLEVLEANVPLAFYRENAPVLAEEYLGLVLRAGSEQLARQNEAVIARPDAREHLPRVTCPTLVLCGLADQLAPPACSQEIAALVPRAELHLLPRCGHMLTMEAPDRVGDYLAHWLRRLQPA